MRRLTKLAVVALVVVVAYFLVTFAQVWTAARRDSARSADAIVVLGAAQYDGTPSPALRLRLDHAFELWASDIADVIVVTGGRKEGDRFTEALAGFSYLREAGVPEAALRIENQGTNTWESLAAAARILRGEDLTEVVLVSSPYHSLRVEHVAAEVGLRGHASPARTASLGAVPTLARETLAVGIGRIVGYHRLVDFDRRAGDRVPTP